MLLKINTYETVRSEFWSSKCFVLDRTSRKTFKFVGFILKIWSFDHADHVRAYFLIRRKSGGNQRVLKNKNGVLNISIFQHGSVVWEEAGMPPATSSVAAVATGGLKMERGPVVSRNLPLHLGARLALAGVEGTETARRRNMLNSVRLPSSVKTVPFLQQPQHIMIDGIKSTKFPRKLNRVTTTKKRSGGRKTY